MWEDQGGNEHYQVYEDGADMGGGRYEIGDGRNTFRLNIKKRMQ